MWVKQNGDMVEYLESRKRRRKTREKEVWVREVGVLVEEQHPYARG